MKKDWIQRELTIEIIVGVFMVMIFLGLGYFTIMLSRDTWLGKKSLKDIYFKNVMGLSEGDSVVARGMPVGKVKALELEAESDEVRVVVSLDDELTIRSRYRITIVATSILGGRYLKIDEGTGVVLPPGCVLRGLEPYDLMDDAAKLMNVAKKGVVEGKVIENLVEATRDMREVAARLNSGKGIIGKLLSEEDSLYDDLSSTVASLKKISERLEKGQGTLGKLLTEDNGLYKNITSSADSLSKVSERLEKGQGTLGKLMAQDDGLYKDLSAAVSSLKKIIETIEKGEGSIGRLVQDDSLYEDMQGIIGEARATIDDFRETAPIITFTSIFFGAF